MKGVGHGQLWWADLDKVRPVLVLTRARVAPLLTRLLVAPVTTTVRGLATEVAIGSEEGVRDGSVVSLDNAQLLAVGALLAPTGQMSVDRWPEVCSAMASVLAC